MIREGDKERGSKNSPYFDGTNYPYWKIHISAYLQSISSRVWEICEDEHYEVLAARVIQEQIDQYEANSKARNAIFFAFRLLNLIVFLTQLRLRRSGKLLKNIMRRTDVSMRTLFNYLESRSIRCFLGFR